MPSTAKKRISKSTLSMFLRTKCDRELYLSLHEDSELKTHSMPVPLQARPGIGVLQTAGRDFEDERNDQLIQAFGRLVIYHSDKDGSACLAARQGRGTPVNHLAREVRPFDVPEFGLGEYRTPARSNRSSAANCRTHSRHHYCASGRG